MANRSLVTATVEMGMRQVSHYLPSPEAPVAGHLHHQTSMPKEWLTGGWSAWHERSRGSGRNKVALSRSPV